MVSRWVTAASVMAFAAVRVCDAQPRLTRAAFIERALAKGPRVAIAAADAALARAELARSREYENPVLGLGWSRDTPQQHVSLDAPLSFLWLRTPRIAAAKASLNAASMRYALERQQVIHDADTTYTRALSTAALAALSRSTARDADSLVTLARIRRDAGDGSDLELEVAALNAGQMRNVAAVDSLEAVTALRNVQLLIGADSSSGVFILADSLEPPAAVDTTGAPSLMLAAASEDVRAAELGIALERRQRFAAPSFNIGYETHDPGGLGNQLLPTIGLALPLPLFNQNRGAIMAAEAQRDRARAQLELTRREVNAALINARSALVVAQERAERSRQLVERANRVASLSLLGYREGATALSIVLEAQRIARENLAQYVTDVAAARNAASLIQFLQQRANITPDADRNRR